MVIQGALSASTSADTSGRIVVDESDYRLEEDKLPFEIKEVVRIRANEKFSKYYECFDEIGEGKFGKVYRCREKATGLELAAKRIKIRRDADRAQVEKEVAIMTQMRHPRIAQIYDAFSTPDNDIILVMEVVRGGELFDRVVDDNYILTEMAVVMIVCQLCEAVSYIHSKNIVHLDIKPENIMCVSQTGNRIKLIDFGLAQYYDGSSNLLFMAGTPEFVAPEVIKFEPIDFHTDMWSIGVITYILLSGISPFLGETLGETYCAVEKGEWEFDEEAFEGISDAAKDFISKLLVYDQKKRMLPEQCLQHEWIVGSRARAANDLLLNQPNIGKPLSKEGLKSYLKNKRFRKATWALVFLIRFRKHAFMNWKMPDNTTTTSQSHCTATTTKTPILSADDSQFLRSSASDVPIADGIGPSTSTEIASKSEVLNVNTVATSASLQTKQRDEDKETVEKLLSVVPKKVKANAPSCETPEKEGKVVDETGSLSKSMSNLDTKRKRSTDGSRRGDDWQINPSRNRPPINTSSEINRKANSVASILSKFAEKDEVSTTPKHLERKSSRAGRTLRDVERPLKKMSSVLLDDLPPAAMTNPSEVPQSRYESLEKDGKVTEQETKAMVELDRRNKEYPLVEASCRAKVPASSSQTTQDEKAPKTKKESEIHLGKSSATIRCSEDERTRCTDDTEVVKNSVISKAEKSLKEKRSKESLDERTEEKHCTSMIIPMKFEKSSAVTVKMKTTIKNQNTESEKSFIKAFNGQLIEESRRSEKNDTSISIKKSITKQNCSEHAPKPTVENDSRIAQFRSVALQAEMQKKTTTSHENGETTVELTRSGNTHSGKVHLAHERKLDNTCVRKNSATITNEIQDTALAEKITSTSRCTLEPHVGESLTLTHKENFASRACVDGKISTQENSNSSSIKISTGKPPTGRSCKRHRAPKKTDDKTFVSDSDGSKASASETRDNCSEGSNAETNRSTNSDRSNSSINTISQSNAHKNGRTLVSRASSDASSESSDLPSSDCKSTAEVLKNHGESCVVTKDLTKFSDSYSSMTSKSQKLDLKSPQSGTKTEVVPRNALSKPKTEVTTVSRNETNSRLTLLPSQNENYASVEMNRRIAVREETTKSSSVKKNKAITASVVDESCARVLSNTSKRTVFEKLQVNYSKTTAAGNETLEPVLSDIYVAADAKRKPTKKGKKNESSSEEETKKPKLSFISISSRQEYERHQKRVEPSLSWRSELLKSFDGANKKREKTEGAIQVPKISSKKNSPLADTSSSWFHDKDGYGSDGEYMKRPALKTITSSDKKKAEYHSLANIPLEEKTPKDAKLSKRKVTFSNEVRDPKPTAKTISTIPGFALSRVQSESNIAEKAKISMETTLKIRRMTMDDTRAVELQTISARQELFAKQQRLKRSEISNFDWLKTRLESRITDEKEGQTWRSKNEFKIPICAAQNAKRALDMWKTMEQSMKNS